MTEPIAPLPPIAYATPVGASEDQSHLKALAICHWVLGGLTIVCGFFPIIHIAIGIAVLNGSMPMGNPGGPNGAGANPMPPTFFGWFFIVLGSIAMLVMWTIGSLTIYSGFCIRNRRRRLFSVVIAGILCIGFPIGTTLGVFTLLVLFRDSVKRLYGEPIAPPPLR